MYLFISEICVHKKATMLFPTLVLVYLLIPTLCANKGTDNHTAEGVKVDYPFTYGCLITEIGEDKLVDCSFMNLTFIPALPKSATSVDLSNNQIGMILFPPFLGMTVLRTLDISDNPLKYIPLNIFNGLIKLRTLVMKNSLLYKQKNIVLDSVLAGLNSLRHLSFTFQLPDNRRFSPIPCGIRHKTQPFGKVDSLQIVETLEIDSALLKWRSNITTEKLVFRTKSLYLINGVFCYYGQLKRDQLKYMKLLENFTVENPFLTCEVTSNFVTSMTRLKQLAIYGPNAPFGPALKLIANVTQSISNLYNLTSLTLQDISDNTRLNLHCSLGIYNLTRLHTLQSLNLAGNSLSLNTVEECDQFPTSLKYVNLERNCISSFDMNFNLIFFNKQIEIIEASDQSHCVFKSSRLNSFQLHTYGTDQYYDLQRMVFTNSTEVLKFGAKTDHYHRLKYLDLSLNNKVLSTTIPSFFSCSRPVLEHLNMSDCRISELQDCSFANFSKLEYLDLSWNLLGYMGCLLSDRLIKLSSLRELNISHNQIKCIKSHLFDWMEDVERIDISNNDIDNFNASLTHTKNLYYLDLSVNRLKKLSKSTMEELDELALAKRIQVDISRNLFLCTCESLEFLNWMTITNVNLLRKDEYFCAYSNGSVTKLNDLSSIVNRLNSQCTPKTFIFVTTSTIIAVCLVALCGILTYRFRWRIRYFYYKAKIKIPYKPMGAEYEEILQYDVFISYSSEDYQVARQGTLDELEEKRDFHACIHERDFKPGESIAFNISHGILNSRRIILFLSKSFLASEWCMYEFNIARMKALHTGRKLILVVMLEDIPNSALTVGVLDIISAYTYLEYPKGKTEIDLDVFWSKCADFISDC